MVSQVNAAGNVEGSSPLTREQQEYNMKLQLHQKQMHDDYILYQQQQAATEGKPRHSEPGQQFFLNEWDHLQQNRGFGSVAQPNLKHMYDGVRPELAVEMHRKKEMKKKMYAQELEIQMQAKKAREIREKELSRAVSREYQSAREHGEGVLPGPKFLSPRKQLGRAQQQAPSYNNGPPPQRNPAHIAQERPAAAPAPRVLDRQKIIEEDPELRQLRMQVEMMQRQIQDQNVQQVREEGNHAADARSRAVLAEKEALRRKHMELDQDLKKYALAPPMGTPPPRLQQHNIDEQDNARAARLRNMENSPSAAVLRKEEDLRKQQYARDLQQQIAEKAERDAAKRKEADYYERKLEDDAKKYDPFGKMGGGAPLRNAQGEKVADLHLLANEQTPTKHPAAPAHEMSAEKETPTFNFRKDNPWESENERDAASRVQAEYQEALRQQIIEKQKIKDAEMEKERLADEKEERRLAEEQRKLKDQYEKEQEKERLKREQALVEAENVRNDALAGAPPQSPGDRQRKYSDPIPLRSLNFDLEAPTAAAPKSPPPPPRVPSTHRRSENDVVAPAAAIEKLRNDMLRQQDQLQQAMEDRIIAAVQTKDSEIDHLKELARMAEVDREAARTELEMIRSDLRMKELQQEEAQNIFEDRTDKVVQPNFNEGGGGGLGYYNVEDLPVYEPVENRTPRPMTGASVDLGASLVADSQFIFPIEGQEPPRTAGAAGAQMDDSRPESRLTDVPPSGKETPIARDVEDIAERNAKRMELLNELEGRRHNGENLDILLAEFLGRSKEGGPTSEKEDVRASQDLGKTLVSETRWI